MSQKSNIYIIQVNHVSLHDTLSITQKRFNNSYFLGWAEHVDQEGEHVVALHQTARAEVRALPRCR